MLSVLSPTKYKSTGYDDQAESEKRKRLIELAFGSEPTIPEDPVIGQLEIPEIPSSQIETIAHMATLDFKKSGVVSANKSKILEEGDEKLTQKIEKIEETPLVDAEHKNIDKLDINKRTSVLCSGKDTKNQGEPSDTLSIFDEVAKRCLNSPGDKIDSKLLEQMERLGVLQSMLKDTSNIPKMEDETVQIGCTRRTRKPRKKTEVELETRIFERDTIKIPRRNFINRRAMRHIAMRMGTFGVSELKTDIIMNPVYNKEPVRESTELLEFNTLQNKGQGAHFIQGQELPYNLNPNLTAMTLDERTESEYESNSPAVILSEECADAQDCEVNYACCKQAGRSELDIGLEEIKRIFDEEKIPLHTFMDLNSSMKPPTEQDQEIDSDFMTPEKSSNDSMNEVCVYPSYTNTEISHTGLSPEDEKLSAEAAPSETDNVSSEPITSGLISNESAMKVNCHVKEIMKYPLESMDHCRHCNAQSHAVLSTMMNVQEEATNLESPEPVIMIQKPESKYNDENISLSEMLRRVRQRARLETLEQFVFTSQVTESDPSVNQKQPPSAPLATPRNPSVISPRPCPGQRPKPKESNPCKPPKTNTCEKFRRTTLVDTFGVVVTRVPEVDVPQNWPDKALDREPIPKPSRVLFVQ